MAQVGVIPSKDLKLFGVKLFFKSIPTYVITMNVTDGRTICCGITALCVASRDKSG